MSNLNKLTKKLLKQGYSPTNYPPFVRPIHNYTTEEWFYRYGGFEYQPWFRSQMVFSTGCGLLCKGTRFQNGYSSSHGIDWRTENDNPIICCPYRTDHCKLRNPFLDHVRGGGLVKLSECDCHVVDEPYDYERSVDKVHDEEERIINRKYQEYEKRVQGHVCRWHMYYDYWNMQWNQIYDPVLCARMCQNVGGVCTLRDVPITAKRGNVFYDVKITSVRVDDTIFSGQEEIRINKGCQFFEHGTSLTICEEAIKHCVNEICSKEQRCYHVEKTLYNWEVEIFNIRVEYRESRDLIQDLADIREGIKIVHASDAAKTKKREKSARRIARREKSIQKLEKKIVETGLEPGSLDEIHARKWLEKERLNELQELHWQKREEEESMIQINIMDLSN